MELELKMLTVEDEEGKLPFMFVFSHHVNSYCVMQEGTNTVSSLKGPVLMEKLL